MADQLDPIDELLRADEDRLKQRRTRLRALSRAIDVAREAIASAQDISREVTQAGDLTRARLAETFALTRAERAVILPGAPRTIHATDVSEPDE